VLAKLDDSGRMLMASGDTGNATNHRRLLITADTYTLDANPNRTKVEVKNFGTVPVKVSYGNSDTTNDTPGLDFNDVMVAGIENDDGMGGSMYDREFKGDITFFVDSGNTGKMRLVITEWE
jgi:hypothetical protein